MPPPPPSPALAVTSLTVQFGGLTALDDVSFSAPQGAVLGLIGRNGAGKTTCFNAITGMAPARGSVRFEGEEILGRRTEAIARRGVARTFQHVAVVPDLTVRDNVLIGAHRHGRLGWIRSGLRLGTRAETRGAAERADAALERLGLQAIAGRHCSDLGLPNLKLVELARAVAFDPALLLLDEPANGLTHSEVDELADRIVDLRQDRELTIVVVEHHMGLIRRISDRLIVLNFGSVLAEGEPDDVLAVVMLPRFEPLAALRAMERERVTFFGGVPTMYWGMLGALADSEVDVAAVAASLRVAVAGGAALPVELHREFERRLGVAILEGYGLSETSPVASFSPWGEPVRVGSIGRPIPGVEMRLVRDDWSPAAEGEVGEIAIKGPNVMKGYLGRPEATGEAIRDGWFRSGDLARRDEAGFYYIVDRSKDLIIRGGYNVYPREIEEVLLEHPGVSLAAVIGVPDDSHGEEVKAVVIRTPGAAVSETELVAWEKERMAAYKYPRLVEFRDSLPMTATGKILKRELS